MNMENVLMINNREALRKWLESYSEKEKCCWVSVSIKQTPNVLLYLDAVEEALCFGWIDGIKKKDENGILMQRLSPRKKNSSWTQLNIERAKRLINLGIMTRQGKKILPDLDAEFIIYDEILEKLQSDLICKENFENFPELYKKIKIDNIQSVYKDKKLFNQRLEKFITNTSKNLMYGNWNDNGRLNK